jgi:hypothetical protein
LPECTRLLKVDYMRQCNVNKHSPVREKKDVRSVISLRSATAAPINDSWLVDETALFLYSRGIIDDW